MRSRLGPAEATGDLASARTALRGQDVLMPTTACMMRIALLVTMRGIDTGIYCWMFTVNLVLMPPLESGLWVHQKIMLLLRWNELALNLPPLFTFSARVDVVNIIVCVLEWQPRNRELVRFLFRQSHVWLSDDLMKCALANGCRRAVKWLHSTTEWKLAATGMRRSCMLSAKCLKLAVEPSQVIYAAKRGDLATVQWLQGLSPQDYRVADAMIVASKCGHAHIVRWLASQLTSYREMQEVMVVAGEQGHLELMQWAATEFAAKIPHWQVDVLTPYPNPQGLDMINIVLTQQVTRVVLGFCATRKGLAPRQEASQLPHQGYPAMDWALESDDRELFRQLHAWDDGDRQKTLCTVRSFAIAAESGDLDMIQWLHEHRPLLLEQPIGTDPMDMAAGNGHLHVLQWLFNHRNAHWSESAFNQAARNGHFEVLRWLCDTFMSDTAAFPTVKPYRLSVITQAVAGGHQNIYEYLTRREWPFALVTTNPLATAVSYGRLQLAKHLYQNKEWPTKDISIDQAAQHGHLETLQWAQTHLTCRDPSVDLAFIVAQSGRLDIVRVLIQSWPHVPFEFIPPGLQYFRSLNTKRWLPHTRHCYQPKSWNPWLWDDRGSRNRQWPDEDPWWAKRYVELCLDLRPDICLRCSWLCLWAVRLDYVDILERLLAIHHPQVLSLAVYRLAKKCHVRRESTRAYAWCQAHWLRRVSAA